MPITFSEGEAMAQRREAPEEPESPQAQERRKNHVKDLLWRYIWSLPMESAFKTQLFYMVWGGRKALDHFDPSPEADPVLDTDRFPPDAVDSYFWAFMRGAASMAQREEGQV
jgi:hypothetical protein